MAEKDGWTGLTFGFSFDLLDLRWESSEGSAELQHLQVRLQELRLTILWSFLFPGVTSEQTSTVATEDVDELE